MKKRFLLFISLLTLSSCSLSLEDFFPSIEFPFLSSSSATSFTASKEFGDNYYQPDKLKYTLQDINSQVNWVTSECVGNQKMLIVPVQLSSGTSWTTTMLNTIDDVFFGESSDTTFESVQSYFLKSSYNTLNIGGAVTDVFKSKYTKSDIVNATKNKITCSDLIAEEFYNSSNASLLKEYDVNKDGFVDNCVFIYSNNYASGSSSKAEQNSFWAWCTYYDYQSNSTKPSINNYMWASYNFINDGYSFYNNNKPDAHTFIHETGHLLGLDDYYCYDDKNAWDCAGQLDMQSYNVGDHNIYSKMALGWVKPYVVTDSASITLKTSALYPQAILINDSWNGSAFDEYIIIEYYTPQGLNKMDSEYNFNGREKMYNYNGLRIYHVDSRMTELNVSSEGELSFKGYTDDIKSTYNSVTYIGSSNSTSYSYLNSPYNKVYRLLHLIDQGEKNVLNNGLGGSVSRPSALWTGGKTFSPSSKYFYNGVKFNDGTDIGYSISVANLTDEECLVTIKKIER